jgi:cysteine desulfurase
MSERIYLDHNATSPLRNGVREAVLAALDLCGNPSSVHAEGRAARGMIEAARDKVARLVGARAEDVIFTSGGTEANALALNPQRGDWACYMSGIEHPSVLAAGRFPPDAITSIPANTDCVIDLEKLATALANSQMKGRRPFVSVMAANNETGAVQPVAEAAAMVHEAGGLLHSDAVQAAGKVPFDLAASGADMISLSAHKLGGPKGVGALVLREGVMIEPLIKGGGQERRRRAGTENVSGIVGFGVAAELASADLRKAAEIGKLRDELEARAVSIAPDMVVFSAKVARLPNTSAFAVPGTKAETLLIGLDLAGVAVSSGSACSSGKVEASHVLKAMGVAPELAQGALRVSLGPNTTKAEIDRFIAIWSEMITRLKRGRQAA